MRDQVEEVKLKTDIVSLIGEHVTLTKAGKHYKGLCPFHSEKTPSFTVSPELQIFKCFGCGESGDVFSFLEKYEGMEFSESLKFLADRAGVKLQQLERSAKFDEKQRLYELNDLAAKFYHYILTKHASGKAALLYVLQTRGISKELVDLFQIGYAPEQPSPLLNFLAKKKFIYDDIVKAGLVVKVEKGGTRYFDRFRGRVIFPLYDHRGNAVGLAGRILPGAVKEKELAKYINSPETPVYHKSQILYGLHITRPFIKRDKFVVVVEGEVDCISTFGAGIKNVVAIKGSALTEEHVRILARLTDHIVLALDADLAGDAAARRGIVLAQSAGMSIKVMTQSTYKDPDEFARGDPQGFKKAIQNAIGVWDFIIDSVIAKYNAQTGEGKAQISRELIPMLLTIEDNILQSHYAGVIAKKLQVDFDAVLKQLDRLSKNKSAPIVPVLADQQKKGGLISRESLLEEELLSWAFATDPFLLLQEGYRQYVTQPFGMKLLTKLAEFDQPYSVTAFAATLPAELRVHFQDLILHADSQELPESKKLDQLEEAFKQLRLTQVRTQLETLAKEIEKLEESEETEELRNTQDRFAKLSKTLAQINQER